MYNIFRYYIVPPIFVVFFPFAVQFLAWSGYLVGPYNPNWLIGNSFSWKLIGYYFLWAFAFLKYPCQQYHGPVASSGYIPHYQYNGVVYYWFSLVAFMLLQYMYPNLSISIFENMPSILGTLNIVAFILCIYLLIKGKLAGKKQEQEEKLPIMYEFYRGMELHPRIMGVDVKQLTNSRLGMMGWQLLILAFFFAGVEKHRFNFGFLVNLLLQSIYVAKFFWWETGYFNTLDITLDRAGYYICWGCLVWLPCLYTFSSYYFVAQPPIMETGSAMLIFLLGIASILLNYRVDYEKEYFRKENGNCNIWGKPASYIEAEYATLYGKRKSKLLISGFWGISRHMNYVFEIASAFFWCLPGLGDGFWPFLYTIFLIILLIHRIYRDEEKCAKKYGHYWTKYCQIVRYRMVPYIF